MVLHLTRIYFLIYNLLQFYLKTIFVLFVVNKFIFISQDKNSVFITIISFVDILDGVGAGIGRDGGRPLGEPNPGLDLTAQSRSR